MLHPSSLQHLGLKCITSIDSFMLIDRAFMTGTQKFYDHWNRGVYYCCWWELIVRNNGKTSVTFTLIRILTREMMNDSNDVGCWILVVSLGNVKALCKIHTRIQNHVLANQITSLMPRCMSEMKVSIEGLWRKSIWLQNDVESAIIRCGCAKGVIGNDLVEPLRSPIFLRIKPTTNVTPNH